MNVYEPPKAHVADHASPSRSVVLQLAMAPLISAGIFVSMLVALQLLTHIPPMGSSRSQAIAFFISLSALIAFASAAPWWLPVAYLYGRRAFLVGAILASLPAGARLLLQIGSPMSATVTATMVIETAGLVLLVAAGSHLVARRLGSYRSSKPAPLRGVA